MNTPETPTEVPTETTPPPRVREPYAEYESPRGWTDDGYRGRCEWTDDGPRYR